MYFVLKSKSFIVAALFCLTGCFYDKEAILYPGESSCLPVTNPTFNLNVLPLLNAKCNTCHGGSSPSAGIKLVAYTDVAKYITSGSLIGSIKHMSGFSAMPKNGSQLPACEIQIIQDWITLGALNN